MWFQFVVSYIKSPPLHLLTCCFLTIILLHRRFSTEVTKRDKPFILYSNVITLYINCGNIASHISTNTKYLKTNVYVINPNKIIFIKRKDWIVQVRQLSESLPLSVTMLHNPLKPQQSAAAPVSVSKIM